MIYIEALNLINECLIHSILKGKEGRVFVYRDKSAHSKAGWYLEDKDMLAKELMNSEDGQKILIQELKNLGVEFTTKKRV